jgi:hypothetical protein
MYEKKHQPILPIRSFLRRAILHFVFGFMMILISLLVGIIGYVKFGPMGWVEAYENAAMILSGMGPVSDMTTVPGKIFAGSYALFSGIVFLSSLAVFMAPVLHRFLHKFVSKEIK